jgi:hypothetical protein
VFKDRVLSKTFGPKKGEVSGDWKRLHKEELRDLSSTNASLITPSMTWIGQAARIKMCGSLREWNSLKKLANGDNTKSCRYRMEGRRVD